MSVHDNKVAIITGGAQGIGRGVVDVLASEGAKVCIADISEEHGKEAVETIKQSGGSAMFVLMIAFGIIQSADIHRAR